MQHQCFCFSSSKIGKKYLVAVTGIGLSVFVLMHMLGNLLILVGPEAYNKYGHALTSNPAIYLAEVGLVVILFIHLALAMRLTRENWKARPVGYAVVASGDKATSLTSRSVWAQGILIFVFMIHHLITFKFGPHYDVEYGGVMMRDLHRLVIEVFQNPLYVGWYLVALLALGFHLSHGVRSSIQTLGIHHPRYFGKFKAAGIVYAVIVGAGFISQPLYVFLIYKG